MGTQATCLYCGADVSSSPFAVRGLCDPCSARALGRGAGPAAVGEPSREERPRRRPSPPAYSARLTDALAQLVTIGPPSEAAGQVAELQAADKRSISLMALIPVFGPRRLLESTTHGTREKHLLLGLSAALTGLLVAAMVMALAPGTPAPVVLRQRVQTEAKSLDRIAEDFRFRHGRYPDALEFRQAVEQAHVPAKDPWGRPYLYQPTPLGVTFGTLGRNGVPGGMEEDADVTATFPASGP